MKPGRLISTERPAARSGALRLFALARTLAALVLVAASLLPAASPAAAEEWDTFVPLADGWQTYVNTRFGVRFDYPADIFTAEEPPQNGGGRSFTAPDASLLIYASHNTLDETPATMKHELIGSKGYEEVTYSPSGKTWLVLSGYRGDMIFYEKYFFADGMLSAFAIEFPKARKPFYAPVVERIENSFKAGHSD